jgi:hypothetical protein
MSRIGGGTAVIFKASEVTERDWDLLIRFSGVGRSERLVDWWKPGN